MTADPGRLVTALILVATALFLMSGRLPGRWRRAAAVGALAIYGALLAGIAVWVALWLLGASF